jgi:hypothetical protein
VFGLMTSTGRYQEIYTRQAVSYSLFPAALSFAAKEGRVTSYESRVRDPQSRITTHQSQFVAFYSTHRAG